jgi:hypothetical protein
VAGGDAGGIASAARLLAEHGGAIEADLQRYYGLHVGDFPWPLTARRLRVLVKHLPEGCQVHLGLLDPAERSWSTDTHMLANVIDELRLNRYVTALAGVAKNFPAPAMFPRPGSAAEKPKDPERTARAIERLERRTRRRIPDEIKAVMMHG